MEKSIIYLYNFVEYNHKTMKILAIPGNYKNNETQKNLKSENKTTK